MNRSGRRFRARKWLRGMGSDRFQVNLKLGLTSRQESSGKEEVGSLKPFSGTLRVTNPVRKSRASSRKRVLRGGWVTTPAKRRQPDQKPCD